MVVAAFSVAAIAPSTPFASASTSVSSKAPPRIERKAHPFLCSAAARDTKSSTSRPIPRAASCHRSLSLPASITKLTSSIVIEVSAMLVATTHLRTPRGGRWKALRWSAGETDECRGKTQRLPLRAASDAESREQTAAISAAPGKKMSTAPPVPMGVFLLLLEEEEREREGGWGIPASPSPPPSFSRSSVASM